MVMVTKIACQAEYLLSVSGECTPPADFAGCQPDPGHGILNSICVPSEQPIFPAGAAHAVP